EFDSRNNSPIATPHFISHGIMALNNKRGWMSQQDQQEFWGDRGLNVKIAEPNTLVPILLDMQVKHNGNAVPEEIFALCLAYNLRNYAGHNIKQQSIITTEYDRIISS